MHTFLLFFAWPLGLVWSNIIASMLCAAWVTVHNRAIKKKFNELRDLHFELKDLHILHHEEHMQAIAQASVTGSESPARLENGGDA